MPVNRRLVITSTSLVVQTVKRLPTIWETQVQPLGQEDTLEKEMATHCRTLAWKTPWMEQPGRPQSMGLLRVRHDDATSLSLPLVITGSFAFWFKADIGLSATLDQGKPCVP